MTTRLLLCLRAVAVSFVGQFSSENINNNQLSCTGTGHLVWHCTSFGMFQSLSCIMVDTSFLCEVFSHLPLTFLLLFLCH